MALILPSRSIEFSNVRALILDPSLSNRRLLHDILNDLHCKSVAGAAMIDDAWGVLRKGGINTLFLDWSSDMDAPGILQMLREPSSPERYVPVVVVASYSGIDDVMRARDCGATEFMLRPFSKEVVASRLRAIVRLPRLYVESDTYFGPDRRRHHQSWSGLERRRRPHYADRRAVRDPTYQGPERRLETNHVVAPPPLGSPLSPQGVVPMSTSQESVWQGG
ncbi:MAG: two-component system response regulator [Bacteroidales bacterium]